MCAHHHMLHNGQQYLRLWLPCLVSPEREDLVDTDDCTETTEVVSAMVLSVINPPPSPSVWTVIVDWQKEKQNNLGKRSFVQRRFICIKCKKYYNSKCDVSLTIVLSLSLYSTPLLVSARREIVNSADLWWLLQFLAVFISLVHTLVSNRQTVINILAWDTTNLVQTYH